MKPTKEDVYHLCSEVKQQKKETQN